LDVDGNGTADALSDGILMLRYLFDRSGAWNVNDALGAGATRTTREAIKAYLDQYNPSPAPALGLAVDTALLAEPALGASDSSGSDTVEPLPAAAAVPPATSSGELLRSGVGAAIVAGGDDAAPTNAGVGLDLRASQSDTLRADVETAGAANLQAVDGLLRSWDPSVPDDRRIARLVGWINRRPPTDDAETSALDEFYGEDGLDWFLTRLSN
jgi:hypothetical protein